MINVFINCLTHKLFRYKNILYFKNLISIMQAIAQSARKNAMIFCSQIIAYIIITGT